MVACRIEENFKDPLLFNPDRWLGNNRGSVNPYLVLPFGHGMRACIARRLAEQNILVLLLRVTNILLLSILESRNEISYNRFIYFFYVFS